jgi:hAT family C-terminal dimerisation region
VIAKLEKRYSRLEKPPRILPMWLHPSYTDVARVVADSGIVDIMTLTDWVDGYSVRWGFKDSAVSAALAAQDWSLRYEPWAKRSDSFGVQAGKYWTFFLSSSPASSRSDDVRSRHLLAKVARKLLAVLPNSADPESVFSELGLMITPSRTSLADSQRSRMLFIAADFRAQEREDAAGGGSVMQRTAKKFSERAAAVVRLNSIGRQPVASFGRPSRLCSGGSTCWSERGRRICGAGSMFGPCLIRTEVWSRDGVLLQTASRHSHPVDKYGLCGTCLINNYFC